MRDAHAARETDQLQSAREHVRERQEDHRVAALVHDLAVRRRDVEHLAEEVLVREDRALGFAGRARCVDNRGWAVAVGVIATLGELVVADGGARRDEIVEGPRRSGSSSSRTSRRSATRPALSRGSSAPALRERDASLVVIRDGLRRSSSDRASGRPGASGALHGRHVRGWAARRPCTPRDAGLGKRVSGFTPDMIPIVSERV